MSKAARKFDINSTNHPFGDASTCATFDPEELNKVFGKEVLKARFSSIREQTIPYDMPVWMGTRWCSGDGMPLKKITYLSNKTGNYYYTNGHDNDYHALVMDFVDIALNIGTNINTNASQTKSILMGCAGELGYYSGLLMVDEEPSISNDQANDSSIRIQLKENRTEAKEGQFQEPAA